MTEKEPDFERSFARLEEILARMNSGKISLDESLKLYEEADKLITTCTGRLNEAEVRIETLIKNRSGEIAEDAEGQPLTAPFSAREE